jgi:hypothetical protein
MIGDMLSGWTPVWLRNDGAYVGAGPQDRGPVQGLGLMVFRAESTCFSRLVT